MPKKILVTAALPYANGPIHLGHLVEYIQTDIYVKFLRLTGKDVIFVCAEDAHGTPIEVAALKEGVLPEVLVDRYHREHEQDFKDFLIKFDSYHSTDSKENKEYSDLIFNKLQEKGLIYQKDIELSYCKKCKRFLPDRYVKGKCPRCESSDQYGDVCEYCSATYETTDLIDPYCTICGTEPTRKVSKHYFFKLSALNDKLSTFLNKNKNIQPEIKNYIKNWIKEGLRDWCISRDGPYFGFKIPGEDDKYYYVWLDAPIGYIASTAHYCHGKKLDTLKDYWQNKDCDIIHFIGKDIIYFHFLFWPAMLMNADFQLPTNYHVHGFLTVNGEKMSKSRGTFFTAKDYLQRLKPEYLRFFYAHHLSRKLADIDLNFKEFQDSINNELIGNLTNFCYRTLSFLNKKAESKFKKYDENKDIIKQLDKLVEKTKKAYSELDFRNVVKNILAISDVGNKYFQEQEIWKSEDKEQSDKVFGLCVNISKIISIVIQPILPKYSKELQKQLNLKNLTWDDAKVDLKNHAINKAAIVLKKIEEKDLPSTQQEFPLNLQVAQITEVKNHPKADKLLILKVKLKKERQIVAGLRGHYDKDDLINKKIVIVANLKPAKLRGEISQGMLLAAERNGKVKILEAPESEPGDQVIPEGYLPKTAQIKYEEFAKVKLTVKDKKVFYENKPLKTETEEVFIDIKDNAQVR